LVDKIICEYDSLANVVLDKVVYCDPVDVPAEFSQYDVLVTRDLVVQDTALAGIISHTDAVFNQRDVIIFFLELCSENETCECHKY